MVSRQRLYSCHSLCLRSANGRAEGNQEIFCQTFYVKWGFFVTTAIDFPRVSDGLEDLRARLSAGNIFSNKSKTAEKEWFRS